MAFSPIVVFARIVAPEPIDAPFFITVRLNFPVGLGLQAAVAVVARGYRSLMNITPCPINTLSSMVTPSQMKVWLEILQRRPTVAFF